jgi:hypothetical protein
LFSTRNVAIAVKFTRMLLLPFVWPEQVDGATTQIEFFDTTEGDQASLGRKLKRPEIDSLSVVALAGAVGEVG